MVTAQAAPLPTGVLRPIETDTDVAAALAALVAADPRLLAVAEFAGPLPLRRRSGGFEGLAHVVMGQQISIHAADAIWRRLHASIEPFTPEQFLLAPEEVLRAAGLSRAKVRTLSGIASACADGLHLEALHDLPGGGGDHGMIALKGVGRGRRRATCSSASAIRMCFRPATSRSRARCTMASGSERPDEKRLRKIAENWSPWRGVAAGLFWAYYRARRERTRDAAA